MSLIMVIKSNLGVVGLYVYCVSLIPGCVVLVTGGHVLVTEMGEEYQSVCFEFMWLVTERLTKTILFAVSSCGW